MSGREDKLLKSTRTFLARWQGASVDIREMLVSHRMLRIVLYRDPLKRGFENLVLSVPGPEWICGPFEWDKSAVDVTVVGPDGLPPSVDSRDGPFYRLADLTVGFELFAGEFRVAENLKLK